MDSDENNIYGYNPSIPAGALFLVLFGASTGYHIYQLIKARALYFIPFAIGGAFQVIGYLFRLLSHNNTDSTAKYALQTVLILIAPALYAASIYMVLGRLVTYLDAQQHSLVRVTWMTKIFVTGDVVSFLMQCGGGGLMAGDDPDTRTIGENITIIGLVVQVVFFGFFLITSIIFHWRINRTPTARSTEGLQHRGGSWMARNWVTLLIALFDATLMLFVMGILNFWHPCYVISDGKGYQRRADLDEVPLR